MPHVIAWDLETCPQPLDALSARQRRRHDLLVQDELKRSPALHPDEASRKARSLHPMLGWICCLSVVRVDAERPDRRRPKSYTAAGPTEECALLETFWQDLARLPGGVYTWVTFNGKRFDADWLRVRSAAHGLTPSRRDILDRYPFKHTPHCDLARVFECRSGLADLCDLLGVESPKADMDGSGVAVAVQNGHLEDVAAYCERDVLATLDCYLRLAPQL
jgi:hypothetical protein